MAEESVHTKNQCESSDDEDQEATAKFLEVIDQRFRDGDFPAVLPQEQDKCADAADILMLVQKEEAVALQSYIDDQYKLYRENCCADASISEAVRRADWARKFYYKHMENFVSTMKKKDVIFDDVRLLVDIEKMPESAQKQLQQLCESIPVEDREAVLGFIDDVWKMQLQALPPFMCKD